MSAGGRKQAYSSVKTGSPTSRVERMVRLRHFWTLDASAKSRFDGDSSLRPLLMLYMLKIVPSFPPATIKGSHAGLEMSMQTDFAPALAGLPGFLVIASNEARSCFPPCQRQEQ